MARVGGIRMLETPASSAIGNGRHHQHQQQHHHHHRTHGGGGDSMIASFDHRDGVEGQGIHGGIRKDITPSKTKKGGSFFTTTSRMRGGGGPSTGILALVALFSATTMLITRRQVVKTSSSYSFYDSINQNMPYLRIGGEDGNMSSSSSLSSGPPSYVLLWDELKQVENSTTERHREVLDMIEDFQRKYDRKLQLELSKLRASINSLAAAASSSSSAENAEGSEIAMEGGDVVESDGSGGAEYEHLRAEIDSLHSAIQSLRSSSSSNPTRSSSNDDDGSHFCKPLLNRVDPETDLNLTCPCTTSIPSSIGQIHLVYHVGMVETAEDGSERPWIPIVRDQLRTLDACGLGRLATSLTITYTPRDGGNLTVLQNLVDATDFVSRGYMPPRSITFVPGPAKAPWEATAIDIVKDMCEVRSKKRMSVGGDPDRVDDAVIFYFHNKGASKYRRGWKRNLRLDFSYSRSLYWRKYMEYFTIERPSLCLEAIGRGASTCGVQLIEDHSWHYSGNIWAASCRYVSQLPKLGSADHLRLFQSIIAGQFRNAEIHQVQKYIAAELWIGLGLRAQYNQSLPAAVLFGRRGIPNLYEFLLKLEHYRIHNETEAVEYIIHHMENNVDISSPRMEINLLNPIAGYRNTETWQLRVTDYDTSGKK